MQGVKAIKAVDAKNQQAFILYQAGELSVGAACELAGLDRYTFLELCKGEGITVRTQTPDELEADFRRFTSDN